MLQKKAVDDSAKHTFISILIQSQATYIEWILKLGNRYHVWYSYPWNHTIPYRQLPDFTKVCLGTVSEKNKGI